MLIAAEIPWLEQISPLAAELVQTLASLAPAASESALLAAALAVEAVAEGHVCVDLGRWAGRQYAGFPLPFLAQWQAELQASGLIAKPGDFAPLVLEERRLYLARYWRFETQLAADLLARAEPLPVETTLLRKSLDDLFGPPAAHHIDWQKAAAAAAVLNRLTVISGGPGTGKTTTVVKLLAALTLLQPDIRIALAAPTGKAAARMVEAIRLAKVKLPLDMLQLATLPDTAQTLHRLLGARPDSPSFRHDRENPLPYDTLVVDEASMIDLALLTRLVAALPPTARLILLGDKDQLASVEAGAAFADLCAGTGVSAAAAKRLAMATGMPIPPQPGQSRMGDSVVLLRHSYRFDTNSGIGALARAANAGNSEAALNLLDTGHADLGWHPGHFADHAEALADHVATALQPYWQAVTTADPVTAFQQFGRFRLLTAHRDGEAGVSGLNRLVEARLVKRRGREAWYAGRPVLITANDYGLRLYNGDIGIALQTAEGLRVYFERDGDFAAFAPQRLPPYETAYAMTVHKSQGSEFDTVALVLPDSDSPVLTRNLVYTALTRARRRAEIWGPATVLAKALATATRRDSGLADRLRISNPS